MVAMRMRWAGIAVLGMWTGCGRVAASAVLASSSLAAMVEAERACCAAVKGEAGMVASVKDGGGMVQTECVQHGCGALGSDTPLAVEVDSLINAAAIDQQVGLRAKPTCDASEWHDRCPPGSAMILAHRRRGCVAAGCVRLKEEGLAALQGAEDDEDAVLRAVVAQEADRLREAGVAKTFHVHSSCLRKEFEKSQKRFLSELKKTMATSAPSRDAEHVRALVEEAAANGFSNVLIDDAKRAVLRHDGEQRAWSFLRSLPGAVLSKMVERQTAARKEIAAKIDLIASLQNQVYDLVTTVDKAREAAVVQEQRLAEAGRSHQADLDTGAAREAELEEKVVDLNSNLRRVTEGWGAKFLELEGKLEMAVAAGDVAAAEVVDLTFQLQEREHDAVAVQIELEEKVVDLNSNLRRATEVWGDKFFELEGKLDVAVAAGDVARAEVVDLTFQLQEREHDAVVERELHDTAVVALREELAQLQRAADEGAAREVELEEEIRDLDSNVRWSTEVWGDEALQLEEEVEVAVAAGDVARAEVVALTSKLQQRETDAAAERERHHAAEVALEEELAQLQQDADAGAAREVELEEEIRDLDSNVRWVTEVWGDKVLRAEEEVEVAVAANDRAQAKVVELTSQLEQTEKVAVAERGHHDAEEFALREELGRLHQTADAAAKRCLEEQERLHAERAVAVLERDGARVSLASCAVHVEEVHSRSVDLFLAVSEAAYAGQDPVTDTNQQEAPSAVREKEEIALEEVSERTRARLDEVETTVAASAAWREQALHACGASLDALREDFVVVEKLLVLQEEDTARAEEYGLDLAEELAFFVEKDAETQMELDSCYADLAEINSASADLSSFVSKKAFVAGSTISHSGNARLETALDRGLPREDVKATFLELRPRFEDIKRTVDSLVGRSATELGTCVQNLQQAWMREEALESSRQASSGLLVGHNVGDDVGDDQDALSDGAAAPKPDDVALQSRDIPPAG